MTSYYIIELLIQHILAGILFITPQPPPHTHTLLFGTILEL